jgi:hypothetical protein
MCAFEPLPATDLLRNHKYSVSMIMPISAQLSGPEYINTDQAVASAIDTPYGSINMIMLASLTPILETDIGSKDNR